MDLTGVTVAEAAPIVFELELALAHPDCNFVVLQDSADDSNKIRLTRREAEQVLRELEAEFFGSVH